MAGKHHDLVDFTKKYKGEEHTFFLDLKRWRRFKTRFKLNWQKEPFVHGSRAAIPAERGIYAFTTELATPDLPKHGYILYVGITGNDSDANLHKRFDQYLRHLENEDGRPAVLYMLKNWERDLFFNFVPLPNMKVDLEKLERALLNAILPPVNKRDLDADITAVRAARF